MSKGEPSRDFLVAQDAWLAESGFDTPPSISSSASSWCLCVGFNGMRLSDADHFVLLGGLDAAVQILLFPEPAVVRAEVLDGYVLVIRHCSCAHGVCTCRYLVPLTKAVLDLTSTQAGIGCLRDLRYKAVKKFYQFPFRVLGISEAIVEALPSAPPQTSIADILIR